MSKQDTVKCKYSILVFTNDSKVITFWFLINSCDAARISLRIDIILLLTGGNVPFRTFQDMDKK